MVMNITEKTKQNEGERGVQLCLEHKCTEKVLLEQSGGASCLDIWKKRSRERTEN